MFNRIHLMCYSYLPLRCFGFPVGFGLPPTSARAFGGNPVCCVNIFPPCGFVFGFPTRF
jgi:hypothetical protein